MGRDKYENEELIKYGLPEDVWFHVDDLSSAHVYLRMKPDMTLDDINDDLLLDCTSLVKANSIEGCKKASVYVVYTRWKNLLKTNDMVDGQVGYHRKQNVRRVLVEKNNSIVRQIEKTKMEINHPPLYEEQQQRLREIENEKKAAHKKQLLQEKQQREQQKREKEERSYDRFMKVENMTSNKQIATADTTAAETYEDDFF